MRLAQKLIIGGIESFFDILLIVIFEYLLDKPKLGFSNPKHISIHRRYNPCTFVMLYF